MSRPGKVRPLIATQRTGLKAFLAHEYFALFDEPGMGKTRICIEAAKEFLKMGEITRVMVVCPAPVRFAWADPEFGELAAWGIDPKQVFIFDSYSYHKLWHKNWQWVIVSYDILRSEGHHASLIRWAREEHAMIVMDESSYIKAMRAARTKACIKLARYFKRRYILNGTPIANTPEDLYSQFLVLDYNIIDCSRWVFRLRYCKMGGYMGKQVVGLAKETQVELYKKIRPFYFQRRKKEALDLPPVTLTPRFVPMEKTTWKVYVDMRDELIAILSEGPGDQKILTASNAGVKLVRLMEITAGQVEENVVGSEKINDALDYIAERQEGRLIIWTWFRVETTRVATTIKDEILKRSNQKVWGHRSVGMLIGGMSQPNREKVLHTFNNDENGILVSQLAAGGMGLNMQRASNMLFLSRAYSLLMRIQAIGRIDRMGQTAESISVVDSIATGPKGQPTVDRAVLKALKRKTELANWTRGEWLKVLQEEKTAALRSKDLFDASDLQ